MAAFGALMRRHGDTLGVHAVLIAGSVAMAYPLLYSLVAGVSTRQEIAAAAFMPIPHHLNLAALPTIFGGDYFPVLFRNTTIRALWYGFWPILLALLSGYAFARLRFPGRRVAFLLLLASLMVPGQVSIVPLYIMVTRWPLIGGNDLFGQGGTGMLNTWWALLALGLVNVYAIFLIKQSIEAVPMEYDEAARSDGANVLRIIFQIHLPMLKPVIATLVILAMISTWNDFWTPLIFTLDNRDLATIALGVANYGSYSIGGPQGTSPTFFLATAAAMLPPIAIYLFFQRYLVQGFAMVGIKG
jgi:multiple sugar transport system permease protein